MELNSLFLAPIASSINSVDNSVSATCVIFAPVQNIIAMTLGPLGKHGLFIQQFVIVRQKLFWVWKLRAVLYAHRF